MSILTNRLEISIHLDGETGESVHTNVGICQGNSLSAILSFFLNLSCALEKEPGEEVTRNLKSFLDIFYADDLIYVTTEESHRADTKKAVPKKLNKYNLDANHTKTEEGDAPNKRPSLHLLLATLMT